MEEEIDGTGFVHCGLFSDGAAAHEGDELEELAEDFDEQFYAVEGNLVA